MVAVPVASRQIADQDWPDKVKAERTGIADEMVVLEQPKFFRAVAQVYDRWYDVPDSEVMALMMRWREEQEEEA